MNNRKIKVFLISILFLSIYLNVDAEEDFSEFTIGGFQPFVSLYILMQESDLEREFHFFEIIEVKNMPGVCFRIISDIPLMPGIIRTWWDEPGDLALKVRFRAEHYPSNYDRLVGDQAYLKVFANVYSQGQPNPHLMSIEVAMEFLKSGHISYSMRVRIIPAENYLSEFLVWGEGLQEGIVAILTEENYKPIDNSL